MYAVTVLVCVDGVFVIVYPLIVRLLYNPMCTDVFLAAIVWPLLINYQWIIP